MFQVKAKFTLAETQMSDTGHFYEWMWTDRSKRADTGDKSELGIRTRSVNPACKCAPACLPARWFYLRFSRVTVGWVWGEERRKTSVDQKTEVCSCHSGGHRGSRSHRGFFKKDALTHSKPLRFLKPNAAAAAALWGETAAAAFRVSLKRNGIIFTRPISGTSCVPSDLRPARRQNNTHNGRRSRVGWWEEI